MSDETTGVGAHLRGLAELAARVAESELAARVDEMGGRVVATLRSGGCLFFCGNGGSAADAQHLATEYVVRFRDRRPALPAVALTTDTSLLTAAANDFGFETVFARQIEALGRPGDMLFLHSTSGESENLLRAARAARAKGVVTVAFLARGGGRLGVAVDHAIVLPTDSVSHAQEVQLALGHAICDQVDRAFTEPTGERSAALAEVLEASRAREKSQALFYRTLAAAAASDAEALERLNDLHADEQHHLSRLTARLLELGHKPRDLHAVEVPETPLAGWEAVARAREAEEVRWYESLIATELDSVTRSIVEGILNSERHHHRELRGKWMPA